MIAVRSGVCARRMMDVSRGAGGVSVRSRSVRRVRGVRGAAKTTGWLLVEAREVSWCGRGACGGLGKIQGEGAQGHLFPVSWPGVMKWSMKFTACRAVSTAVLVLGSTLGCSDASDDLDKGLGGPSGGGGDVIGAGGNGVPGTGGDPVPGAGGIVAATGGSGGTGGDGPVVHPTCPGDAANAYQGTARAIPGTIEAEDFDPEGYSDTTPGNEDGAYRTDVDVDIKALGDGYAISWFVSGEWLEFTVDVATEGDYEVTARAGAVEAGRTLELSSCEDALGTIAVPRIDDWGQVKTSEPVIVHLKPGVQVLRVTVGALDYADLDFSRTRRLPKGDGSQSADGLPPLF